MIHDILWSPRLDDCFATVSNSCLVVHKIKELEDNFLGKIEFEEGSPPSTVAWQPGVEYPYIFAFVGQPGKIILQSGLDKSLVSSFSLPEIVSGSSATKQHERECLQLCWNQYHTTMLTGLFASARNEASLYIWDVVSIYTDDSTGELKRLDGSTTQPFYEIGHGERIDAFAWVHSERTVFAVGCYKRGIKLYDLRAGRQPTAISGASRYSFNLCARPNHDYHISATCEDEICFWDMRKLEDPAGILQLSSCADSEGISKCEWMTTSPDNTVTILSNGVLRAIAITDTVALNDASDFHCDINFRIRTLFSDSDNILNKIKCFATSRNRPGWIVAFSEKGSQLLLDVHIVNETVQDFCAVTCSTAKCVNGTGPMTIDTPLPNINRHAATQLNRLKHRLNAGYGTAAKRFPHEGESADVKEFWDWIRNMEELSDRDILGSTNKYMGIKQALKGHNEAPLAYKPVEATHNVGPRAYSFPERLKALMICGWCASPDQRVLEDYFERLQNDGYNEPERVAVVAILHGYFQKGIDILMKSGRPELFTVAAALTGLMTAVSEKNTSWLQMINPLLSCESVHPYIRLAYNFVSNEDHSLSYIETIEGLRLVDVIGFGCRFYSDTLLMGLIDSSCRKAIRMGELNCLFIAGITGEGMEILQSFVNRTGDLQTAAMIGVLFSYYSSLSGHVIYGSPSLSSKDHSTLGEWIECYRDALDMLGLCFERTEFDAYQSALRNSQSNNDEVVGLVCSYCGKPFSHAIRTLKAGGIPERKYSERITYCNNCKKNLPRCSMCAQTMGSKTSFSSNERSRSHIDSWFTWCVSCKHGGHVVHMNEWFESHNECPVLGCKCHCRNLDRHTLWMK